MGYTHYFEFTKAPTDEKKLIWYADIVNVILNESGVNVQFESDDDSHPAVTPTLVRFNGVGDEGHETFYLDLTTTEWAFCKTARKPYDEIVVACLLAAAEVFGEDFKWTSDGSDDDFHDGKNLLDKTRGLISPID